MLYHLDIATSYSSENTLGEKRKSIKTYNKLVARCTKKTALKSTSLAHHDFFLFCFAKMLQIYQIVMEFLVHSPLHVTAQVFNGI